MINARMIVCEYCGNKRCPHAVDVSFACTGSNDPGQIGTPSRQKQQDVPGETSDDPDKRGDEA